MTEAFKRLTFQSDEYLLKEGTLSNAAYLILSGKVEIRLGAFGDNPRSLAVLGKGDVIGEMSVLDNTPHMASAIAIEETVVNALSADEFNRRVDNMDPLMRGVLKIMVNRVRNMGEDKKAKQPSMNWENWKKAGQA
ncbi:MAG: cyclic nucleotide-binding domain-containing protein [Rhodospirillaceae bacterium]|nr:cyclic nucleotide-binding domain-containing protein [Rhodospirillaceae bacterium]